MENDTRPMYSAEEAAKLLHVSYHVLRTQAKTNPKALGFPVCQIGDRLWFPKRPLHDFLGIKEG